MTGPKNVFNYDEASIIEYWIMKMSTFLDKRYAFSRYNKCSPALKVRRGIFNASGFLISLKYLYY